MRTNWTIFGVGLMITGAILYHLNELIYILMFTSENTTPLGKGILSTIGILFIFVGIGIAFYNCKKS